MNPFKKFAVISAVLFFSFSRLLFAADWYISYEKALEAIKKQQWEAAVGQLNAAIADKAESKANAKTYGLRFIDYFPYLYRGIAHYELGNYRQAQQDLEKEENFGEARKAANDKAAAGTLQRYLNLIRQRQIIAAKFNDALQAFNQAQYEKAKIGFDEVLKLDPNYAEARKYQKTAADELEKAGLAKVETEKKSGLEKEFNLGVQLFNRQNFDDAEKQFNRVLDLDKNYAGAADYLDKIKAERVKLAESTARAQFDAIFSEGIRLFEAADWNGAEAKFKAALKLDPADAGAAEYLKRLSAARAEATRSFQAGERLFSNQEWDKAEEAFLAVIRFNKNDARAQNYLREIAANRGASANRQRVESMFAEGVALFDRGDLKNAKNKFLNVQRLDPTNGPASERLNAIAQAETKIRDGVAAFFEGSYDQAIAQLADAIRLYGANAEARAFLGCALVARYFLSGEEDKDLYKNALEQFNEVKRLNAQYKLDGVVISPRIAAIFNSI